MNSIYFYMCHIIQKAFENLNYIYTCKIYIEICQEVWHIKLYYKWNSFLKSDARIVDHLK